MLKLPRLKKKTVQKVYKVLTMSEKEKNKIQKKKQRARTKRREAKRSRKDWMIKAFGKTRYYLALWFGPWILWTGRRCTNEK
jgi:hypothetical protein